MHHPSLLAPPRPLLLPFLPPPRPHRRFPRGPAVLHRPPRTRLDATSRRPLPILALLSSRRMPGARWLRTRISGKELISEVQLTGGRGHPGQKSWIVSLSGIDTVDKAKQIVGSTFLVKEDDRPDLEEDEFYTHDLVGMRVVLKLSLCKWQLRGLEREQKVVADNVAEILRQRAVR
ncbi:hypothetical protein GW17_00011288 [Ensete ventricosum]|nr:hypothetical protein GW17_00011288 [Ensete ventricosum]